MDVRRFPRGQDAPSVVPPAPRTRCNAPGVQAECAFLRQVSLHKQRKVARAVTAKASPETEELVGAAMAAMPFPEAKAWRRRPHGKSMKKRPAMRGALFHVPVR